MKNRAKFFILFLIFMMIFSSCKKQEEPEKESKEQLQGEVVVEEIVVPSVKDYVIEPGKSDPRDVYDATGFVAISDVIPNVILDIRYYSTYNFVGDRIQGYEEPIALLSKEATSALLEVSKDLEKQGYGLKIFDAYRPQCAVEHFVSWAENSSDVRMKEYFYPDIPKTSLFSSGYIARRSGHSRGATVDLTLYELKTGKEVDMGGSFDFFGKSSHPSYKQITAEQYEHRMLLQNTMKKYGFKPCVTEWWDFTYINEPYPNTYFTFPVSRDSLKETQE